MTSVLKWLLPVFLAVCVPLEAALGPHEVVLLVNENSSRSLEIANSYAALRHIPARNIIRLALPSQVLKPAAEMGEEDFIRHIWAPANEEILRRGISEHVLAWIYSSDFPVRIIREKGSPVSLTGITFMRSKLPDERLVASGQYVSPLFCGPKSQQDRIRLAESFDSYQFKLGSEMPLPAMMLAYTGTRGLSVDESIDVLRCGEASDGTRQEGPVVFVKRDNIRSKCRDGQYLPAANAIQSLKGRAEILDNYPDARKGLMGLFDGVHEIFPSPGSFLPGAVAEHLTSHAANFSDFNQSKLSVWLRAGATASSGTVVEPFAIGAKFANPFFFSHYLSGCSIIESYYQAVQCPLQLLMVGEPLAAPWAERFPVMLVGMETGPLKGKATFYTDTGFRDPRQPQRIQYFLDGVLRNDFAPGPMLSVDTTSLSDGYHELRAVVRRAGPVAVQSFSETGFIAVNKDRKVELVGLSAGQKIDLYRACEAGIAASGQPRETGLMSGEFPIPLENGRFDPKILGVGPARIQARAIYEDGMEVRSAPVELDIARLNRAPVVSSLVKTADGGLQASASDPEGDTIHYRWFTPLDAGNSSYADGIVSDGVFSPDAKKPSGICIFNDETAGAMGASADVMVPPGRAGGILLSTYFLFDVQDSETFCYFGASGETGAWTLGVCRKGTFSPIEEYGASIPYNTWLNLSVRHLPDGAVEGLVDGERVCVTSMQKPEWSGRFGFLIQKKPLKFKNLMVCVQDGGAMLPAEHVRGSGRLVLQADDGFSASEKEINLADL